MVKGEIKFKIQNYSLKMICFSKTYLSFLFIYRDMEKLNYLRSIQ